MISVPAYKLLVKVLDEHNLICCEKYANTPIEFTYFQDTLHRYTLIDHMFASAHLANKIIKYSIIESGVNFSDHVPICCVLALPKKKCSYSTKETESWKNSTLRWDKWDCNLYYHVTSELFQNLQVLYELLEMTNGVDCGIKQQMINLYYNDIINVLNTAAMKSIPVLSVNSSKPFWSAEVQTLKEDSIQAHKVWADCGKLRSGWVNSLRLRAKSKYKPAMKHAEATFNWDLDEELSQKRS